MNIRNLLVPLACLVFFTDIQTKTVKTSVIIPCYYKHTQYLYSLLKLYEQQTSLADEVVISISEIHKVDPAFLLALQEGPWLFPVKIFTSEQVQQAGTNKNICCNHATGDIFIIQDADDIPHPQRVEIIKYFFENYEVDHIMHRYFWLDYPKDVDFVLQKNFASIPVSWAQNYPCCDINYTNGEIALTKEVFNKIQWTAWSVGEDVIFNREVYVQFKHCLLIDIPLLSYNFFLSSHF